MTTYKQIVLASRPQGEVVPDNFRLETVNVPALNDGQVLIQDCRHGPTAWLLRLRIGTAWRISRDWIFRSRKLNIHILNQKTT